MKEDELNQREFVTNSKIESFSFTQRNSDAKIIELEEIINTYKKKEIELKTIINQNKEEIENLRTNIIEKERTIKEKEFQNNLDISRRLNSLQILLCNLEFETRNNAILKESFNKSLTFKKTQFHEEENTHNFKTNISGGHSSTKEINVNPLISSNNLFHEK